MVALFAILTVAMGIFMDMNFYLDFLPLFTIVGGVIVLIGSFFRKKIINIITTSIAFLAYLVSHGYFFIDEIAFRASFSDPRLLYVLVVFIVPAVLLALALMFAIKGKKKDKKSKNKENSNDNAVPENREIIKD